MILDKIKYSITNFIKTISYAKEDMRISFSTPPYIMPSKVRVERRNMFICLIKNSFVDICRWKFDIKKLILSSEDKNFIYIMSKNVFDH